MKTAIYYLLILGLGVFVFLKLSSAPATMRWKDSPTATSSVIMNQPSAVSSAQSSPSSTKNDLIVSSSILRPTSSGTNNPASTDSNPIKSIRETVAFVSQAPTGNWSDLRQEDGCEEASSLMALSWSLAKPLPSGASAETALTKIADWEQKTYQNYHDTSVQDTADRILAGYFHFKNYQVKNDQSVNDLLTELAKGNILILPMDGTKLNNPNFKQPGPPHHMLVIIGYDSQAQELITNDPGTHNGASYRYPITVINNAWRDYLTGQHLPTPTIKKNLIVIRPSHY